MRLVANWRKAYKWISMWCMALSTAFLSAWGLLSDELRAAVSSEYATTIAIILLVVGMVGRLVPQNGESAPPQ